MIWTADALSDDDTTVNALARRLGVDWHTLWDALESKPTDGPTILSGCATSSPLTWTSTSGARASSAPAARSPAWWT